MRRDSNSRTNLWFCKMEGIESPLKQLLRPTGNDHFMPACEGSHCTSGDTRPDMIKSHGVFDRQNEKIPKVLF